MGFRVGIVGASGYAGGELIRLVDGHPGLELVFLGAHSKAGDELAAVHPHLGGGERLLEPLDALDHSDLDLAFLALPHGSSSELGRSLTMSGVKVADLGSDYRLDSADRYVEAYQTQHPFPFELGSWAYGLPELFGDAVKGADKVAVPGCYPTATLLGLGPLLREGVVSPASIVVDALSGVSGGGRGVRANLMYGAVSESATAYAVLTHRHRPEIEQALSSLSGNEATVLFTPHLVPMQRGLLATCYADIAAGVAPADVSAALRSAYEEAVFVDVLERPPQTRWVVGSNRCLVFASVDGRTGKVVVLSAIDNLVKGAAGQAVQCANLMLGLDEAIGLPIEGWMP